ncbi:Serine/Threonine kinase domain protein (macronuclear) [Tetrahymena thermophila SB210]|uniref:non-specific serine/threonine protein kinase n=1 Tax=Tetrahymena thermophila (strain SB210) TaxID=312017 RepID=I7M2Q8_TETTS|nr:Serine/Threonine kinase domain protein [Tetrahymena thermophila SB210]EAS01119.2 Serine/Threonine kinase domain protein [Tetrahymena thermophila SB210]|eukprot:XP_001021364.2 Serine/Threonine kinase domain protein [Tetrahymena thermophila SB210]
MRSELSSRSEVSITQGELANEDFPDKNKEQKNGQINANNKNNNANNEEDQILDNPKILVKQSSKSSDSTSPESDYLNFDFGDSEEKKFSNFFLPIKILGSGAFGKVVQAREIKTKKEYAVKIIAKNNVSNGEIDRLRKEAKILSQLDHKNIVKFERVFESETRIFIVMELLLGGTLRQLMSERKKSKQWFTEQEAAQIMNNIINGVAYFHGKSIVHRDLKPDNILIGDKNDLDTVKIADFGLSAAFEAKKSISFTQQCGTLIYMAPEFFIQKTYSKPIDIWSCAIIMYQLLCHGTHPLYDPLVDDNKSFKNKIQKNPQIQFPSCFSDITKNLIQKMTLIDPSARYTANQVIYHPWITQKLEDDIPLTMNEMLSTVNKQTNFSNMQKAICFILFMKMKQNNDQPLVSQKYKEKCKKFSQKKRKESKVNQKIDIYSQNYLNSIIDLDQTKRISSFISDDLSEDAKSQSSNEDDNLNGKEGTLFNLPSDNIISQNEGLSPIQRNSLIQTNANKGSLVNKLELNQQKSASPLLKKYSHRKQLSAQPQNKKIDQGMNEITQFNGITNIQQASNTLINGNTDKLNLQKNNNMQQLNANSILQRRSISLHKTNTQNTLDFKQSDQYTQQNGKNQESHVQFEKIQKKVSYETKESEGNSPGFHIKLLNREELNHQINKRERINTQNSVTIDQQRSVSPRKKNSQIFTIRRDSSRRGQDGNVNIKAPNSVSPIKVANSASPYKNYNFMKNAQKNNFNDEMLEYQNLNIQNQNNSISNTISTQKPLIKQNGQNNSTESPESNKRPSQLKNYSEIPENQKIIHLQKAQATIKLQQTNIQNQSLQTNINNQTQHLNNTIKLVQQSSKANQNAQVSPIITHSVNNQIQNFAKLSSTQQHQKDALPAIQQAFNQIILNKGNSHPNTRQTRAISQDIKQINIKGVNYQSQALNQSMMTVENLKHTTAQNQSANQNTSENIGKAQLSKEVEVYNQNKRMIQNINANKIIINQRPHTKK